MSSKCSSLLQSNSLICHCITSRIWLEASPPPHRDIFICAGHRRSSSKVSCYIVTDGWLNSHYDGIHSPLYILSEVKSAIAALHQSSSRRNYTGGSCKWWYGYIFCYLGNTKNIFIVMNKMGQIMSFNVDYQIILGKYIFYTMFITSCTIQ